MRNGEITIAEISVNTVGTSVCLAIACYWIVRIGLMVVHWNRSKAAKIPPSPVFTSLGEFSLYLLEGGDDWVWKLEDAREHYDIDVFIDGVESPSPKLLDRTANLIGNIENLETLIMDHFNGEKFEKQSLFVLYEKKGALYFDCEGSFGSRKVSVSLCREKNERIRVLNNIEIERFT